MSGKRAGTAPAAGWRSVRPRRLVWPSLRAVLAALSVPNYRLLFQGNFATQIGFGMQQVAFGWLVLELTNSPFYLGLNGFCFLFPMLVVSPFGGVIADRFQRQRVLMVSQTLLMALALGLAALVLLGMVQVWHLLLASLVIGTVMAVNVPARQALVPELVGRDLLANAIALHSLSLNVSRIIGPAVAGALIASVGVAGCFLCQAVGYVWSVSNVRRLRVVPRPLLARQASVLHNLWEGFQFCRRDRAVFGLLLVASVSAVCAMPYMQLLPAYARDHLGLQADGLGLLVASSGAGAVAGSLLVTGLGQRRRRGLVLLGALVCLGVLLVGLGLVRVVPLASLLLAGVGACGAFLMVLNNTVLQERVPDHLRGRVMSAYMVTWGLSPLGAVPLGALAAVSGSSAALMVGGGLCAVFALWLLATRPDLWTV